MKVFKNVLRDDQPAVDHLRCEHGVERLRQRRFVEDMFGTLEPNSLLQL